MVHLLPPGTTSDRAEVEHYDPYSDTWASSRPALKHVTNFTATACHGKLYVIGSCAAKYNALTMQCYNPVIGKNADITESLSGCRMERINICCLIKLTLANLFTFPLITCSFLSFYKDAAYCNFMSDKKTTFLKKLSPFESAGFLHFVFFP